MASSEESSPFFPPELEREIFETTAELYPETIYHWPCLLLIAKRVHEWIERIKYRTIISRVNHPHACPLRLLQNAIRSNLKSADFFYDRVRHLFIENYNRKDELQSILAACSGIQSLMLNTWSGPAILPSLGVMKPRRLSISVGDLFSGAVSTELSHPAFTFVTHLHVWDYLLFNSSLWSQFVLLPALTHLALYGRDESHVISLLSACPKIAVLIFMSNNDLTVPSVDDARFVCMELPYGDYLDNWLAGTKGDVDFWVRTERFIAKKRRGEIQPSSRCWIEPGDGI
ncbi:hypothetical protein FB451DRAFT_1552893 [Mycena latifolia]|nr:hypothetical protein FB451DRAFT_1552893 [Mycena latifolia]